MPAADNTIPQAIQAALAHHQAGRLSEAEAGYRQILQIAPNQPDALHLLGVIACQVGKYDIAVDLIGKAIETQPSSVMYCNLGNALQALQKLDAAIESFHRALALQPSYIDAHYNLGNALQAQGRLDAAIESYRRALALQPVYVDAHLNLGIALQAQGQLEAAAESYRRVLALKPDYAQAHNNLGTTLQMQGQVEEAIACFQKAMTLQPDYAEAHLNLGNSLQAQGKLDAAIASYQQALARKPDYAEAYAELGWTLREQGHLSDAQACYRRAMEIQPDALQHAVHAFLLLPIILASPDEASTWRERYRSGIAALGLSKIQAAEDAIGKITSLSSFYLSYQNCNDRGDMEAQRDFFREHVPGLTAAATKIRDWQEPVSTKRRIRVGFLSEFLVGHTIGKLYQGFIGQLDRSRFEVLVIHTHKAKHDAFRQALDIQADKAITLPARLQDQQRAVAAEALDVLFYPDIGMTPTTYFLAYARLAPVQVVSWGHPDTTGLDTIDYFVSAESIEPEDADDHYTERLVRLNRLPCYYRPLLVPAEIPTREEWGLPESGTLYGCPQSLFKFHPDFDKVLAAIAQGDPEGHIVLLEGRHSAWANQLKQRWERSFPILLERVLILPNVPHGRFMALMSHIDVLLDPVHFGSGNTLYEAMVYGTPVVTWPGRFMRGRIVSGAYRQMKVVDAPIASSLDEYAGLALALGRDHERRQNLRQALREAAGVELFEDKRAVRDFESFLEAAVAAKGRGEKLSRQWRPDNHNKQVQEGVST